MTPIKKRQYKTVAIVADILNYILRMFDSSTASAFFPSQKKKKKKSFPSLSPTPRENERKSKEGKFA